MSSKILFINLTFITIFFLISKASCQNSYGLQPLGGYCTVNLQCDSGCCQSKNCTDIEECKEFKSTIYQYQAIAAAVLVVLFSIYLMKELINLKKDFYKKIGQESQIKDKYCICF